MQSSFERNLRRKHDNPRKTINKDEYVQKIHSCRELLGAAYPTVQNVDKYVWQGFKTGHLWKYLHASRRSTNILRVSICRIFSHEFKGNEKTETFKNNFEVKKRIYTLCRKCKYALRVGTCPLQPGHFLFRKTCRISKLWRERPSILNT